MNHYCGNEGCKRFSVYARFDNKKWTKVGEIGSKCQEFMLVKWYRPDSPLTLSPPIQNR